MTVNVLGFLAGGLTTIAFLPQVLRTWRLKSAHDVSLWMLSLFTTGVALWLVYGILIDSAPVIAANLVTLLLSGANLALKVRYG
jgi:MtN3 and saliva related transmembrane protein